jgi:nucleotide-binding universal stress UspA family protein
MTTILVPLDGSNGAEAALAVGATVARRRGASLHLIRVAPSSQADAVEAYLDEVAQRVTDVPVSWAMAVKHEPDQVADLLAREATARPDTLVCMAAHGRSGVGAAVLGSTSEALIRILGRPVLVVGPHCAPDWADHTNLVIPLDGSGRAERILPYAAAVARTWGLEPWLVQIAHPFDNAVAEQAQTILLRPRQEMKRLGLEAKTDFQWAANAAASVAGQADTIGAALIVMSTNLPHGLARTLIGSVTSGVIHQARSPVLVCPPASLADPIGGGTATVETVLA